jgi:RNA polymerase subunit RPABC4/transcription elongation factor Spt4
MDGKGCPHCGNVVSDDTPRCACGFTFAGDGFEVPGASAARGSSDETLRKLKKPPATRVERPGKAQAGKKTKGTKTVETKSIGSAAVQADPSRLMDCPFCPARISKRAHKCPKCGRAPYLACQICASRILAGSAVCPECGDPDPFNS